jgi:hypothetical protein
MDRLTIHSMNAMRQVLRSGDRLFPQKIPGQPWFRTVATHHARMRRRLSESLAGVAASSSVRE